MISDHKAPNTTVEPFFDGKDNISYMLINTFLSKAEQAKAAQLNSFHHVEQKNYIQSILSRNEIFKILGLTDKDSPKYKAIKDPQLIYTVLCQIQKENLQRYAPIVINRNWRAFSATLSADEKAIFENNLWTVDKDYQLIRRFGHIRINLGMRPGETFSLKRDLDMPFLRLQLEKGLLGADLVRICRKNPSLAARVLKNEMLRNNLQAKELVSGSSISQAWVKYVSAWKKLFVRLNPVEVFKYTWNRSMNLGREASESERVKSRFDFLGGPFFQMFFLALTTLGLLFPPLLLALLMLTFANGVFYIFASCMPERGLGYTITTPFRALFAFPQTVVNFINRTLLAVAFTAILPLAVGAVALYQRLAGQAYKSVYDYSKEAEKINPKKLEKIHEKIATKKDLYIEEQKQITKLYADSVVRFYVTKLGRDNDGKVIDREQKLKIALSATGADLRRCYLQAQGIDPNSVKLEDIQLRLGDTMIGLDDKLDDKLKERKIKGEGFTVRVVTEPGQQSQECHRPSL